MVLVLGFGCGAAMVLSPKDDNTSMPNCVFIVYTIVYSTVSKAAGVLNK